MVLNKTDLKLLKKDLREKPSYERALEVVKEFQKNFGKQEKIPIKINPYGEHPWTMWPGIVHDLCAEGDTSS